MLSHAVPPPPSCHCRFGSQVFAACSSSGFSNGFDGSPGTMKKRHACAPSVELVRGDVAARIQLRAAVADHHDVARHLRRARYGVAARAIDDRVRLPQHVAVACVERIENAVDRRDVDPALPHRHAAVDLVAAGTARVLQISRRFEAPQQLARRGLERIDAARDARGVHHAVDHDRRRLHAAIRARREVPGKTEGLQVFARDGLEGRVMRAAEVTAAGEPGAGLGIDGEQALAVHLGGGRRWGGRRSRHCAAGCFADTRSAQTKRARPGSGR